MKKVDEALLLGLTKKVVKKVDEAYSEYGISKVKKIGFEYFQSLKYPTFKVVRMDKKVYEFTEADFPNLNPKDID